jgi:glucose-1-phosphate thymidylyltransferase
METWGIIPAAGAGTRIQPLAFSKELLPVGCRIDGDTERPRAVSEFIIERMTIAGASRICFVISPGKSDIIAYFGGGIGGVDFFYAVQPRPAGLCDAIFRALPLIHPRDQVFIGLPDTIWFPDNGLSLLPDNTLSFLCFPVDHPEFFDAVVFNHHDRVERIQVKQKHASSNWIWGAIKMPGAVLAELCELWNERNQTDEFLGTLVNEYLACGGEAIAIRAGQSYVDIGTLHGYRNAINLLSAKPSTQIPNAIEADRNVLATKITNHGIHGMKNQ